MVAQEKTELGKREEWLAWNTGSSTQFISSIIKRITVMIFKSLEKHLRDIPKFQYTDGLQINYGYG